MTDPVTHPDVRLLADRYALEERLGSGGAGVVWRAHDRMLGRTVAVKQLHADIAADPSTTERFRAEASAAAKLTHPNAVIVHDIGRVDERDYLVMELVEGGTLADLLRQGPLPPGVVACLGAEVASALGAAHAHGLVHRDVKPANVLVTTDGVAKVADFGIARALGDATSQLTRPGQVMGTARYLAPEQLRDGRIDERADVYALGLVLHQALTGHEPFGQGSAIEVAVRRLADDLPPPSARCAAVPAALDAAVVRATRQDADDRFADGAAFAAAIAEVADPDAASTLAARVAALPPRSGATPLETSDAEDLRTQQLGRDLAADGAFDSAEETTALEASLRGTAPVGEGGGAPVGEPGGAPRSGSGDAEPWPGEVVEPRPRRTRYALGLVAVLAIVAVGVGASLRSGDDEVPTGAPQAEEPDVEAIDGDAEPEPEPADEPTVLRVTDARDHDPFGSGDEHRGDVPNTFDGDPATTWQTSTYRGDPGLGGLKPGVGIWFDLGDVEEVTAIEVTTPTPGLTFTVFGGQAPPEPGVAPEDWGREVAHVDAAEERTVLALDEPAEEAVYLVWLTSLPPSDGGFQARISDVAFTGR